MTSHAAWLRRSLLQAVALAPVAFAAADTGQSREPEPADDIFAGLPLIALNEGRWEGSYTLVRPNGERLDQYDFTIDVTLSRDNARAYRQDSAYRWPDGRTGAINFEAAYHNRQLVWDDGRIYGRLWSISEDTLYLTFGFHAAPGTVCHEMIQTFEGGRQRGRTWLWYEDGRLDRYTLVDERRVDDGPPVRGA